MSTAASSATPTAAKSTREVAIVVTDGSLESAVICGIAARKYDSVLLDISGGGGEGCPKRQAVEKQIKFLSPIDVIEIEPASEQDELPPLYKWTAAIGHAATLARQHEATAILLPMRIGDLAPEAEQAEEWMQIAEELMTFGLSLANLKIESPLIEMEPWQVVELAQQTGAPTHPLHGQQQPGAFVRAGAAKP